MPEIEYSFSEIGESNSIAELPHVTHTRSAKASERGRASLELSASSSASISGALVTGLMGLLMFLVLEIPLGWSQAQRSKMHSPTFEKAHYSLSLNGSNDHHVIAVPPGDQRAPCNQSTPTR